MWTAASLRQLVQERLGDYCFVVVSNRQPYVHFRQKGQLRWQRGAGGVVTALDPVMRACRGTWVAFGDGEADFRVADAQGKVAVPPDNPAYTLKRVQLSKEEIDGYYNGYSNDALWPLCHLAFQRPVFRREEWEFYRRVNEKFARAVAEEVGARQAFIWIHDYHLTLLPLLLKEKLGSQVITAHFWHVPWPDHETFRICPQKQQILEGLLANDLLGFHTQNHCNNFLEVVDRELECRIDRERQSVVRGGRETLVRFFPISVDFAGIGELARSSAVAETGRALAEEFGLAGLRLLLGVDRIDYTKGLPEKILAVDLLLDKHPELREKIVFLQIGELSRIHLQRYKELNDEVNALVERVNWKHSRGDWKPVVLARRHLDLPELTALYGLADACLVGSLHDGMNLVAKEFVSSRVDEQGVLVLSRFTGAARELAEAVLVNPYDREEFADALFAALNLPPEERQTRMAKLRQTVAEQNIFRWAGKVISNLLKLEFKEQGP